MNRGQVVEKLLLGLPVFLDHDAHIAPRVQRPILLLDLGRCSQLAQPGHILIRRSGETLLQPFDMAEEALGQFHLVVQRLHGLRSCRNWPCR